MEQKFDVIVIGSGLAGLTAAFGAKSHNKSVAVIESENFGGVVNNSGSTRKKELVTIAEQIVKNKRYNALGILSNSTPSWQSAMSWVNTMEDNETEVTEQHLEDGGITTFHGHAYFIAPHTIEVNGLELSADKIIIATGSKDRKLPIPGSEYLQESEDFLHQANLPDEIAFIGAGIIGFALATTAQAFGAKVHILQHDNIALKAFDQRLVKHLVESCDKKGIDIQFNTEVASVQKMSNGDLKVATNKGNELQVGAIFRAAGRVARIDTLNLDAAGIQHNNHGIVVNEYLETTQKGIYAIGDCNSQPVPKLATYAIAQADYLGENMFAEVPESIQYAIPSMSTYSQPRIAQTGVLANDALSNPDIYTIDYEDMTQWLDHKRNHEDTAILETITRKSDNRIVGVAALCDQADLLINYCTMALTAGLSKQDLRKMILAYPSMATDLSRFWK